MTAPATPFIYQPDPANPGWHSWDSADNRLFNAQVLGKLLVRQEETADGTPIVRMRMNTQTQHTNVLGNVHGGTIMALSDVVLFAAFHILTGGDAAGAVTLDMNHQFIGAGRIGQPLDAVAEVLRETGRLAFLRGMIEQDGAPVAAFSATIRKPSGRKASQ